MKPSSAAAETREGQGDYVRRLDGLGSQRLLASRDRRRDVSIGILLWPTFPRMSSHASAGRGYIP